MNFAFDELNINIGSVIAEANKVCQNKQKSRFWRVLQIQTKDFCTWEIEITMQDGTTNRYPLQDSRLETVLDT